MSTRRIATALGAAVLLLGAPVSYALAGNEDRPGKPEKVKECSDGIDNDGDGAVDFGGDTGCGSANDNSEADEPAEEPGGGAPGLPGLPPELPALPPELPTPPGGGLPALPELPPGLPTLPELPGGGAPELPALPELPAPGDPAALIAEVVEAVTSQLPPPPA